MFQTTNQLLIHSHLHCIHFLVNLAHCKGSLHRASHKEAFEQPGPARTAQSLMSPSHSFTTLRSLLFYIRIYPYTFQKIKFLAVLWSSIIIYYHLLSPIIIYHHLLSSIILSSIIHTIIRILSSIAQSYMTSRDVRKKCRTDLRRQNPEIAQGIRWILRVSFQ